MDVDHVSIHYTFALELLEIPRLTLAKRSGVLSRRYTVYLARLHDPALENPARRNRLDVNSFDVPILGLKLFDEVFHSHEPVAGKTHYGISRIGIRNPTVCYFAS